MQLNNDNPWPGLESFHESARAFFFGRDQEIKLLRDRVLDAPVTVLYGRSGLGKTSLLQAGLFPVLREGNFLPVYIRFELKQGVSLTSQLEHAVRDAIRAEVADSPLPSGGESLWEYLHRRDFELWSERNYPLTPLIVLDQFEELFTLGERFPDLVKAFRDELGDLAENRIPADLAVRIDDDESTVRLLNLRASNYKFLISLREDFLPDLEGWSRLIPSLGRARVRLLPLRIDAAFDAVRQPAAGMMTDELAHRVVGIVAGENLHRADDLPGFDALLTDEQPLASDVEPALLSLFCRELNEERKRRGLSRFDDTLVEDAKRDTLSNYYTSCVEGLPPRVAQFIESELITEKGFRDSYIREDAVPAYLTEEELDQLIDSRLVRLEDHYGAQRIELTHDVLTRAVREHRDRRRVEEERVALQERVDSERARRLESERVGRRFRSLSAVLAVVCIAALVFAYVAVKNANSASMARADADTRSREALAQRLFADSRLMLNGLYPGSNSDVIGIQLLMVANGIETSQDKTDPLVSAMTQQRDLLKVIDAPRVVFGVAFSPDGKRIVSANGVFLNQWDSMSGQPVGPAMTGHDLEAVAVAYSPDGERVASASWDRTIRLWSSATGAQIGQPLRGHTDKVSCLSFSPDGHLIASGGADGTVRVWDAETGRPIGEPLRGHSELVTGVAFSPDGRRLVSGSMDNTIRLWDSASGVQVGDPWRGHTGGAINGVTSVAFSPDGTRVVSGGLDKTIRLWEVATGMPIGAPLTGHTSGVMSVVFNHDGTRIASGSADKTVRLWDSQTGSPIGVFIGSDAAVDDVAFSPDGLRLASGGDDGVVRIWDAAHWQPMVGSEDMVWAGFSDDGRRIYSGGLDKAVRYWDAETGHLLGEPIRVAADDVRSLWPDKEDRLVSLGSVNTVQYWDARSRVPIGQPLRLGPGAEREVTVGDAGGIAVRTASNQIELWEPDMRPVGRPLVHKQTVTTSEFSPDGNILATGSTDWAVRLWNAHTGEPIGQPMEGYGWVAHLEFSRDGKTLAVSDYSMAMQLWDVRTSKPIGKLMSSDSMIAVEAFSPDGRTLASGSLDGTVRLWNAVDQTQLGAPLVGHTMGVTSLDFSPDGTKLLSASADKTIRMWPLPRQVKETLCSKITHNMSRDQWKRWVSPDIPYFDACPNLPESDYAG